MIYLGPVPASTTIYIPFTTYGKTNGESVTCSGLAVTDIEIYKNGSITQRSSDAGIALLGTGATGIDFDGITGLHGFSIDLSDNTDASFYAVGSWYWVVVSAITVDSQTVTFLAAVFRICAAETTTGTPDATVAGIVAATANKIADHVKRRTQANTEASSDGDTLSLGSFYGLIQQAQESNAVDSPGNLTVYKTDGSTSLGTKALDSDAAADPVVGIS